jgi:hypothetical protein
MEIFSLENHMDVKSAPQLLKIKGMNGDPAVIPNLLQTESQCYQEIPHAVVIGYGIGIEPAA